MTKMLCTIMLSILLCFSLVCSKPAPAQRKELRVFISADMEGIGDVVNGAQLRPDGAGFEYERFRRIMTDEVNASIEGALKAGATKITVADSHGNGLSILPDQLNSKARLIRSWPRPLGMVEGIEGGFDAVFLIGYHASVKTPNAVRAHTISSKRFQDVQLNGTRASEAMLSAAVAGSFGVPVVMVSGDDATVDEVHRTIDPNIIGVVVKRAIGYEAADSLSPEVVQRMLRDGATSALNTLASVHPFELSRPVRLTISFTDPINAEVLSYLPSVHRLDGPTIQFEAQDILEVAKFVSFLDDYDSSR